MAASSSSSVSNREFDVFLSFRGEDTRHCFTSHLHASLVRSNIKVFMDDDALERGDEISLALKDAIHGSKLSIVVFSKDYASSSWCLDELVHILRCRRRNNQILLPIFYHVDPSEVRKQKGNYGASFADHEERFRCEIGKVKIWREALEEAAGLSGWDSNAIRTESELVRRIVEDVLKKLNSVQLEDDFTGFVGLERRFRKIEDLLRVSSPEALRTIGIWGTGGIGKTTLARIVFQRLYSKFDACCFIEDIRVDWEQGRKKYYDSKSTLFDHKCLRGKRVLVVLDNVNDSEQLDILTEEATQFGPGSRVIITTRDMQILRGEVDDTHRVERLDSEEALQLFCSTALRKSAHQEKDSTRELYEKIASYADGIPLALKVLSSFLRGKSRENWEAELIKLKEFPNKKLMNILRMSYDGLDEMQKCIFLDVACFFKEEFRDFAERILEACGLHSKTGLDDLIDKSLISVNIDGKLWIHDLIQQMAHSVVKSEEELENRSRLWISQDAVNILGTNRGTTAIEDIFLDMSKTSKIEYDSAAFQNMSKLRLLKIFYSDIRKRCQISITGDNPNLCFFPDSIRYLHWEEFPWKSFPPSFSPQYLLELNLPYSNVVRLWKGVQALRHLIKIDLSHSKNLIQLPDLSQASKLEHLYLENCTSLREVPSSLKNLGELKTLNLNGCSSIQEFPKLPKSTVCLVLSGTAIQRIPQAIQNLDHLEILNISGCKYLVHLPDFYGMKGLKAIALPGIIPSKKKSWIHRVFKSQGDLNLEFETPEPSQMQVSHYMKARIRKSSDTLVDVELPLYRFDFSGRADSVAIVSISRSVLTKCLAAYVQDLVFINCLGFYGGGSDIDTVNEDLKIPYIHACSHFSTASPIEADIGFCALVDNTPSFEHRPSIPNWFKYQCTGDTVSIDFRGRPVREIMGFDVCAIVDFSDYHRKGHNLLQRLYEDGYKEFNLFCEPTYKSVAYYSGGDFMENCFPRNANILCDSQRSKDISEASFRFWVGNDEDSNFGAKVKKCGVHVIYGRYLWNSGMEADREPKSGNEHDLRPPSNDDILKISRHSLYNN